MPRKPAQSPRRRNYAVFYPTAERMDEINAMAEKERRPRASMIDVLVDEAIAARRKPARKATAK